MTMSTEFRTAGRLCEVIGMTSTLMLAGWYGAEQAKVYVPVRDTGEDNLLRRLVGQEAYRKMIETWPGELLDVPSLDTTALQRAGQIQRLSRRGSGASDIARNLGITRQHVHRVRNQLKLEGWFDLAEMVPDITETNGDEV